MDFLGFSMDFLGLSLDFPWIPEKNRAGGREIERAGGRAGIRMGFLENPGFLGFSRKSWKILDFPDFPGNLDFPGNPGFPGKS